MRLRRYTFKAFGMIKNPEQAALAMKENLNKGSESIVQYLCPEHFYAKDKNTVDELGFAMEGDKLSAIEVGVHDWFVKHRKNEIRECFQMAANRACQETGSQITITGNMKYESTDENLPEYFYHLAEKKSLDTILKDGIVPKRGHNDWKSKKRCTYLTEAQYIVPWLGILDHLDEPVILEVKTDKLPSIEQGRIWEDRDYVPGRIYSEHRTTEIVPPKALRVMSPEEVAALGVNEKAIDQLMLAAGQKPDVCYGKTEENEVKQCMGRLREMGVMDETTYTDAMEAYDKQVMSLNAVDFAEQVNKLQDLQNSDIGLPF